ncbi:hypothetical protein KCV03_g2846, partial [Aureobasidium melanogenum]
MWLSSYQSTVPKAPLLPVLRLALFGLIGLLPTLSLPAHQAEIHALPTAITSRPGRDGKQLSAIQQHFGLVLAVQLHPLVILSSPLTTQGATPCAANKVQSSVQSSAGKVDIQSPWSKPSNARQGTRSGYRHHSNVLGS